MNQAVIVEWPTGVEQWAGKVISSIEADEKFPYNSTYLDERGYHIRLNGWYINGTSDERKFILAHEISHILRGDCLIPLKNMNMVNVLISADSQINAGKMEKQALECSFGRNLVVWSEVAKELGFPATTLPGWRAVYERMSEMSKQRDNCGDGDNSSVEMDSGNSGSSDINPENNTSNHKSEDHQCNNGCCHNEFEKMPSSSGDYEKLKSIHVKAILEACSDPNFPRNVLSTIKVRMPSAGNNSGGDGQIVIDAPAESLPVRIDQFIRGTLSGNSELVRRRTWMREGRTPDIRGVVRHPRSRIGVTIDVSGSTDQLLPQFSRILKYLRHKYIVAACAWDTEIHAVKFSGGKMLVNGGGGGTDPNCLSGWIRQNQIEFTVIITDGVFCGPPEHDFSRSIFILPPGYHLSDDWEKFPHLEVDDK